VGKIKLDCNANSAMGHITTLLWQHLAWCYSTSKSVHSLYFALLFPEIFHQLHFCCLPLVRTYLSQQCLSLLFCIVGSLLQRPGMVQDLLALRRAES